jgi:hypothetical protein
LDASAQVLGQTRESRGSSRAASVESAPNSTGARKRLRSRQEQAIVELALRQQLAVYGRRGATLLENADEF